MAIERMKLLSITGKEENIDQFISDYLLDSGIQTENAAKVFESSWKLTNFEFDSTAKDLYKKCTSILNKYNIKYNKDVEKENLENSFEYITRVLEDIEKDIAENENKVSELKKQLNEEERKLEILDNTKDLDVDITKMYSLEYITFRYGKILKENYGRLEESLQNLNAFLVKVKETGANNEYLYVMCFASNENLAKVDSFLNVFKFQRFNIPQDELGNPKDAYNEVENNIHELKFNIENAEDELDRIIDRDSVELINLLSEINLYIKINNVKKFMAYDENGLFYIIGWVPTKELAHILPKLKKEKDIKYLVENHDEVASIPPTKLKNNPLVRPFETLVKMYGLPAYTEHDPTTFVAITAFLLFGIMFGDVGQGLVIFLLGMFIRKKSDFGAIFQAGGIASIIFGFLYGSVFGSEEFIPALLIKPMENITTMLIFGIAFGVILIIITMILNIYNGVKTKDKKRIFFDTNGLAGLIFYCIVLITAVIYLLKGKIYVSAGVLSVFIIVPLIAIMFKDNFAKRLFNQDIKEKSSLFEKIFNVIEILLSFTSNTISFVRVAAFAINHVGLCMAIYILSDMFSHTGSLIVVILGNVLVIALEGLIVAIQVLRLEYYELFSRFYTGDGKEYKPLREKI